MKRINVPDCPKIPPPPPPPCRIMKAEEVANQIYCDWKFDKETIAPFWDTACGNVYVLNEGGPKDNEYNFCPGCGRHIREVKGE